MNNSTFQNNSFNNTNSTIDVQHQESETFLSIKTLLAITMLLVYTIASPVFEKIHFHYIHESGVSMILGILVTLIAMLVSPNVNIVI